MEPPTGPIARRALIALATLAIILALAAIALPPALGANAQRAYQDALRATVEALPTGWVIVEHYDRGWFSSSASAELTPPPAPGQAPAAAQARIRMDSRIEQGPWAWFASGFDPGPFPALTRVHTRAELVGGALPLPPLLVTTTIGVNGTGVAQLLVPASDPTGDPSGVTAGFRLQNDEIRGTLRFQPDPRRVSVDLRVPALALLADADPIARLSDAGFKADLTGWIGGLFTGRTSLDLGSVEFKAPAAKDRDMTRLQGLHLTLEQAAQGPPEAPRLDLHLDAAADLLRLDAVDYRALVLGLAIASLDAQALAEITAALRTLSSNDASRALRGLVGATLLTQLLPRFLATGPSLTLDPLRLTTPEGPVTAHLALGATAPADKPAGPAGLLGALLNRAPANWLTGLTGDGAIELPQAIALDWLARADPAAQGSAAGQLQTWIDDGWIGNRDGQLSSSITLADGQVTINGKPLPLLKAAFGR